MNRPPSARGPCRAFTLIELLVVIAIIAILIGLLLPAVQKVREAAARMSCTNNLKQIALAAHNYHDANGVLPVNTQRYGFGAWNWSAQQRQNSWSWLARLLPYIEQDNLYRLGNIPNNTFGQDLAVLATPVKTFFCPSDNAQSLVTMTERINLEGGRIALTNYKGVSGSNWCWGDWFNRGPTGNCNGLNFGDGIFYRDDWKKPRRLTDITDGTSNTFMVGEDVPEKNGHCSWPYSNHAVGTCGIGPNSKRSNGAAYSSRDWPNVYSFRSRHPGGLQFAYADGSVHFISDSIPLTVYRALATVSGGEVIPGNY
jgi:prepilin-type N-terminal cleavage/methylation domain-containing protein/prepilin-type processing-associated H-X9-DG protein